MKDWSEWCEERERKKEKKEKEENAYNPPAGCIFSPPAVFLYFLPPAGCFCICRFSFLRACSLFLYVFDCPHLFFVFFYCRFFLTTHSLFYCPQVFCICFLTGRRFFVVVFVFFNLPPGFVVVFSTAWSFLSSILKTVLGVLYYNQPLFVNN